MSDIDSFNERAIFTLQQGRQRLCRWSHPWTEAEQELSDLVNQALFEGAPEHELAALVKALEKQRENDAETYAALETTEK